MEAARVDSIPAQEGFRELCELFSLQGTGYDYMFYLGAYPQTAAKILIGEAEKIEEVGNLV